MYIVFYSNLWFYRMLFIVFIVVGKLGGRAITILMVKLKDVSVILVYFIFYVSKELVYLVFSIEKVKWKELIRFFFRYYFLVESVFISC